MPGPDATAVRSGLLLVACCSLPLATGAETGAEGAERPDLIVVQPGYPGSTEDAAPFMRRLGAYLGARGGEDALTAVYFNEPRPALELLGRHRPRWGIVSLGFYLENRGTLRMRAALEAQPRERVWLVAPRGTRLPDLVGQPVVGGPLYELPFLRRVALADVEGVDGWRGVPTTRVSRGLRWLERGRYRAAVLTGREYRTFEKMGRLSKLETLGRSEEYPVAVLVRFIPPDAPPVPLDVAPVAGSGAASEGAGGAGGKDEGTKPASGAVRARVEDRIEEVFLKMGDDPEGKKILETMGCDGFRRVRPEWLEKLERRHDAKAS